MAVAVAEAVVDRPRVAAKAERDALDSEQVRLARRLTHAATAIRGAVPGSASATSPGKTVQVDPIKPTSKAAGTKHLKLEYYKLLSNVGFKFNLRRYTSAPAPTSATGHL